MRVRPRIQREFLMWLAGARDRLPCRIARISRTDATLFLRLDLASPHVFVELARHGISVGVEWEGERWDDLYDDIVAPQRTAEGYVCSYCAPDNREIYGSRAELWRDHLFEPWLAWLTNEGSTADALILYGTTGVTWAKLGSASLEGKQDHVVAVIPLRNHHGVVATSSLPSTVFEARPPLRSNDRD